MLLKLHFKNIDSLKFTSEIELWHLVPMVFKLSKHYNNTTQIFINPNITCQIIDPNLEIW